MLKTKAASPVSSRVAPRTSILRRLSTRRLVLAYALVAPVVLWRLATSIYPFVYTAYLSFHDNSPVRHTFKFIGLTNYVNALNDPITPTSLEFTAFFTTVSVGMQIVLAVAIALLLNRSFPLRGLVRAVNLLPWAMSAIVIGTAARWMFDVDYGLVNDIIWRFTGQRPLWLVDVSSARFAVVLVDVWKNTAFLGVIFLSGLQGISAELYEAAKIDGADRLRSFWYITLPLLLPLIISMGIFISIARVLSFEVVYALTGGGPGTATALFSYLAYLQAFRVLNFGYASAISMILFAIVLFVGLTGFFLLRRAWAKL
ncbi:MAG: sugar ABC transporter permease [Chloroflexi bacterium]|nr:sugar ABC transporter permease [Chloroflexota bacterium]